MESLNLIPVNIALDIAAAFIFLIIFFANRHSSKKDFGNIIFSWLLVFNMLAAFTNGTSWYLNGRREPLEYLFNYAINFVDMFGIVFVGFWWLLYVDYMIFDNHERIFTRWKFYITPSLLVVLLCVINIFTPIYYYIDEQNCFHRATGFLAATPYLISAGYIIYAELMIFKNRRLISGYRYRILLGFILLPGIASVIQFFYFGVSVEVISLAGSILVIYVSLQSDASTMAARELKVAMDKQAEYQQKLEKAMEAALSASREKSQFMTHMSHDIRTPLNGITGMTEIAETNINNPQVVKSCLDKITLSTKHLSALVNDVLEISKIENGEKTVTADRINILKVFQDTLDITQGMLDFRNLNFIVEQGNITHPYLFGDALHIRQILINIIGNAIKFTPDGGKIVVSFSSVYAEKKKIVHLKFTVTDSGIGISEEFLSHIYEPFSQEHQTARTNYAGTGLGMTIAKSLSDLMGASIDIKSEEGFGTKVTLKIPLAVDYESEKKNIRKPSLHHDSQISLSGSRVLLVEDNEINKTVAKFLLESKNAEVEWAENGKIGLEKFSSSNPGYYNFVLMDIMMPEMNGYEATKAIRALDRPDCKHIPIIAMTANAFDEDVEMSKRAGMNGHIAKPIESTVFFDTINRCLVQNE